VRIVESRPISKQKRWRIMETMTRGNVADLQPREIGMPEESVQTRQAPVTPVKPVTPTTAEVADETPMTSDSTVLAAASDDMDASDYAATPGAPMLDTDEPATEAESVTPDLTVEVREGAASSPAEASLDETPMSSESDVLAAASDDMDAKDYEAKEEDKA
jgi:hypothetical protein